MSSSLSSLFLSALIILNGHGVGIANVQNNLPDDNYYSEQTPSEQVNEMLTYPPEKELFWVVKQSAYPQNKVNKPTNNGKLSKDDIVSILKDALEKVLKIVIENGNSNTSELEKTVSQLGEELKFKNELSADTRFASTKESDITELESIKSELAGLRNLIQELINLIKENLNTTSQNNTQHSTPQPGVIPDIRPTMSPDQNLEMRPNPEMKPNPGQNFNPKSEPPQIPTR